MNIQSGDDLIRSTAEGIRDLELEEILNFDWAETQAIDDSIFLLDQAITGTDNRELQALRSSLSTLEAKNKLLNLRSYTPESIRGLLKHNKLNKEQENCDKDSPTDIRELFNQHIKETDPKFDSEKDNLATLFELVRLELEESAAIRKQLAKQERDLAAANERMMEVEGQLTVVQGELVVANRENSRLGHEMFRLRRRSIMQQFRSASGGRPVNN
ncbi:MAG: hypothetical protein M1834_006552 [Cirrosporium novae-zelandiae]|nr:MAG: hypothetical protein M1834_006552 [Cirrosporium novae-zelandiae]